MHKLIEKKNGIIGILIHVSDYDRVMVLRNGRIAEFDSPATLLADNRTLFYSMVHSQDVS
jgi:ABC-type multidrug transport system fused ATPase/permease subunit